MNNLTKEDLDNLALEAFDLHQKIDVDKKKLQELKKKIIENSLEKNRSYNISLLNGTVRIIKFKESIIYDLDKDAFLKLNEEIRNKFISEDIVQTKLEYFLNKSKVEVIKSQEQFKEINDLISENKKDSFFTVSFWKNKKK